MRGQRSEIKGQKPVTEKQPVVSKTSMSENICEVQDQVQVQGS